MSPSAERKQRQDALEAQMRSVLRLADEAGCYDAADWIKARFGPALADAQHSLAAPASPVPVGARANWRDLTAIGRLLHARRTELNLGLRAAAEQIGCSFNTLSRIERGRDATWSSAVRILDWLEVPTPTVDPAVPVGGDGDGTERYTDGYAEGVDDVAEAMPTILAELLTSDEMVRLALDTGAKTAYPGDMQVAEIVDSATNRRMMRAALRAVAARLSSTTKEQGDADRS